MKTLPAAALRTLWAIGSLVGTSVAASAAASAAAPATDDPSGAPSTAAGTAPAVLELAAGSSTNVGPAFTADLDVETRPFISHFAGLRFGMNYVARSDYRGPNRSQLGASVQVSAGWNRFELAVGLIALQNTDAYNSGRMNVDVSADLALTSHWRLRAEHWSNANSDHPNVGRNLALICYRF